MQTDPARVRRTDPGDPDKCPVWDLHKIYSDADTHAWVQQGCRTRGHRLPRLQEARHRLCGRGDQRRSASGRSEFEENPDLVRGIIAEGCEKARDAARQTLEDVHHAMGMNYR